MNRGSVLITGGSGLTGGYLTSLLLAEGFKVSHLSRSHNYKGTVRVYNWNPEKNILDPSIFEGVDYLVHLAGAGIGEKRWTKARKKEIVSGRVDSAKLLQRIVSENHIPLKAFISASATGYYGSVTSDKIFIETDPPAEDFLGTTCKEWEKAADLFKQSGIRTVKLRTGMVLAKNDGALSKLMGPASYGFFPSPGTGSQYMPWIHIKDLCNIYLKAICDEMMEGSYNAVAPEYTNYKTFVKTLAGIMKKPFFNPPVPGIMLKIIIGERSDLVLNGSRVSPEKIISGGYKFEYSRLKDALSNILQII